jgi:hypothetical protein
MTCDLCQGRLRQLPWEYGNYGLPHADQPVVDAVRASMSIPFFYKPTRLTDADGRDCCSLRVRLNARSACPDVPAERLRVGLHIPAEP